MKRAALGLIVVALSIGCSDSSSNEQSKAIDKATPTVAATVHYANAGFTPATVTLRAGQAIALVNDDTADRRFRSQPTAFDSGPQRSGDQVTWGFTTAGRYQVNVDGDANHHLAVTVQAK